MTSRFDTAAVLDGLKNFQRDTVDYVFKRMYLAKKPTRRFLVADEVGLGKTLVARGVIARTVDHLAAEGVDRIDVVYICSNADIATQNIRRLSLPGLQEFAFSSRLTMLPLQLHDLTRRKLNFVSFTPGTSLDLKGSLGQAGERALLYLLLRRVWPDLNWRSKGRMRIFQGGVLDLERFAQWYVTPYRSQVRAIDPQLIDRFDKAIRARDKNSKTRLRDSFDQLAERYSWDLKQRPREDDEARNAFVGELRNLLARTCVDALEPDLVILDEFQRFKHVLDPNAPGGELAHALFDYSDVNTEARVLMLSATPYKMYTLGDERDEDDHFEDFLDTTRFLMGGRADRFATRLNEFRRALVDLTQDADAVERVAKAKAQVEQDLRRVMVRTERLAITADRNGMLTEEAPQACRLEPADLEAYLTLDRLADRLNAPAPMEYWKSSPYFLNYMDGYQLGDQFVAGVEAGDGAELRAMIDAGLIDWDTIVDYQPLDPGNARMRELVHRVLDCGAWKLLWVPPSLPYHAPGKPFNDPGLAGFTKRLVFSAWNAVPRAIATIASYEAERRMMRAGTASRPNTPEARKKFSELLKLTISKGRLSGMPVVALIYPSPVLAAVGDPLALIDGDELTAKQVLDRARQAIAQRLDEIADHQTSDREDDRWYWAAPFLLDAAAGSDPWLHDATPQTWTGETQRSAGGLAQHLDEARRVASGEVEFGAPPRDLVQVLALLAVASPANVALRALNRLQDHDALSESALRDGAARVAWEFRSLFNLPESQYLIRALLRGKGPYWRQVLLYSLNGNLQAVLDEYTHGLREWLGIVDVARQGAVSKVAEGMAQALSMRSVDYKARDPHLDGDAARRSMRSRFALQFGQRQTDESGQLQRSAQVRAAFNSPFWPFVLASTSVGQEGLDFHLYCHAVMHWNLPSNPVDLEQREGRVHRYKGHAIRKNLAEQYRHIALQGEGHDPWQAMFDAAVADRADHENDLVPYWILPGTSTIERHVPSLPLTREVNRLANLKRTLALYRLVFGQPRQEDLIGYLSTRGFSEKDVEALVDQLRVNLSPTAQLT